MSGADWIRFIPFAAVAFNLFCWAVIEHFSSRPWNVAKVTILLTGYTVMMYIASLALNWSWLSIDWPPRYYDVLRIFMGLTVVGSPFLARNAWWAYRNWHCRKRGERG